MTHKSFNVVTLDPVGKNAITFRFDEWNPRRAFRGVEAARVYIDQHDGQGETWLWMSKNERVQDLWQDTQEIWIGCNSSGCGASRREFAR